MPKPLKRNEHLQPLSRDHHQGLLLCWKLKMGERYHIAAPRMANYLRWFFQHHLMAHFTLEEQHVFPLLGSHHPLVLQALREHHAITHLATAPQLSSENLQEFQTLLKQHIRFEERTLFIEIEKNATPQQLEHIAAVHGKQEDVLGANSPEAAWKDAFWVKPKD